MRRDIAAYGPSVAIDPRAVSGFAAVADAYQRGRPGYPRQAVDRIVEYLQLSEASGVLDLAAGTGQLSRPLRRRVGRITAVEPSAAMRDKIRADLPDVDVLDGTAESIPLADAAVEAVVVGEAFHWFQTAAATSEIARVLTKRGGLALLWNTATWTSDDTPWLEDFRGIIGPHRQAAGGFPAGDGAWREAFDSSGLFEPLVQSQMSHTQTLEPTDLLAQVASWSWIANLEDDQRAAVLTDVKALVQDYREITIPYRTDLYLGRRTM